MQDSSTLGVVIVKHCGYTATVKVSGRTKNSTDSKQPSDISDHLDGVLNIDVDDHPNGGSNALNVHRFDIYSHVHTCLLILLYSNKKLA
jgi:protein TIF31